MHKASAAASVKTCLISSQLGDSGVLEGDIGQMHHQSLGAPTPVQGVRSQTPENDFPPLKSFL